MLDVRCRNAQRCFLSCSVQLLVLGVNMYLIRRVFGVSMLGNNLV
jgi:hypothetical protein